MTTPPKPKLITADRTDEYLERILKAAGSSLRHYTPQSKEALREEMKRVAAHIREEEEGK